MLVSKAPIYFYTFDLYGKWENTTTYRSTLPHYSASGARKGLHNIHNLQGLPSLLILIYTLYLATLQGLPWRYLFTWQSVRCQMKRGKRGLHFHLIFGSTGYCASFPSISLSINIIKEHWPGLLSELAEARACLEEQKSVRVEEVSSLLYHCSSDLDYSANRGTLHVLGLHVYADFNVENCACYSILILACHENSSRLLFSWTPHNAQYCSTRTV